MAGSLLLIDDDPDVLRAFGDYFEKSGYEVYREVTAEGGVELYDCATSRARYLACDAHRQNQVVRTGPLR